MDRGKRKVRIGGGGGGGGGGNDEEEKTKKKGRGEEGFIPVP